MTSLISVSQARSFLWQLNERLPSSRPMKIKGRMRGTSVYVLDNNNSTAATDLSRLSQHQSFGNNEALFAISGGCQGLFFLSVLGSNTNQSGMEFHSSNSCIAVYNQSRAQRIDILPCPLWNCEHNFHLYPTEGCSFVAMATSYALSRALVTRASNALSTLTLGNGGDNDVIVWSMDYKVFVYTPL